VSTTVVIQANLFSWTFSNHLTHNWQTAKLQHDTSDKFSEHPPQLWPQMTMYPNALFLRQQSNNTLCTNM